MKLLEMYPAVKGELIVLLRNVDKGEAVIIEGVADEDLREGLRSVFKSVRMTVNSKKAWQRSGGTPQLLEAFEGALARM